MLSTLVRWASSPSPPLTLGKFRILKSVLNLKSLKSEIPRSISSSRSRFLLSLQLCPSTFRGPQFIRPIRPFPTRPLLYLKLFSN